MKYNNALPVALRMLCAEYKFKSYLEIGVREGDSLATVINHSPNVNRLVLCDTWGVGYGGTGRGNPNHILTMLKRMEWKGELTVLSEPSQTAIPKFAAESPEQFDLILIDGCHARASIEADLKNCLPLLKKGGVMIIDDLIHEAHPYIYELFFTFWNNNSNIVRSVHCDIDNYSGCGALERFSDEPVLIDKNEDSESEAEHIEKINTDANDSEE